MAEERKVHAMLTGIAILFYFSLMLYLLVTISLNIYGWHDQQRIAQLGLLFILLASHVVCRGVLLSHRARGRGLAEAFPSFSSLSVLLVTGFVLCGLASAILACFPRWALLEWALLLSASFGALGVAQLRQVDSVQFDRAVLLVLASVCVFYLLGFLGRYAVLFAGLPLRVWDMFTGFANLRFFGQFQTMTLPLLTVAVICAQSTLHRWSAFALLSGWWMLSITSGTRGTWLALAVAFVAVWLLGRQSGRSLVRWQLAGIAVGLILYVLLFFAMPYALGNVPELINRLPAFTSLSLRDVLWTEAWRMICAHPLLGVGPMHFAAVPNGVGAHPHNAVLQIAAEWGVPAMLMLLALVAIGFWRFVKMLCATKDEISFGNVLRFALFAALVAAATQSLVDGVIVMPYSQVMLMVIAGWSMGIYDESYASSKKGIPIPSLSFVSVCWKATALIGVAALLFGTVIVLALPDVPHLQERMQRYIDVHHSTYFLPRFWQQGWIDE